MDKFEPNLTKPDDYIKAFGEYIEAMFNIKSYDENKKEYVSQIKTEKTPD